MKESAAEIQVRRLEALWPRVEKSRGEYLSAILNAGERVTVLDLSTSIDRLIKNSQRRADGGPSSPPYPGEVVKLAFEIAREREARPSDPGQPRLVTGVGCHLAGCDNEPHLLYTPEGHLLCMRSNTIIPDKAGNVRRPLPDGWQTAPLPKRAVGDPMPWFPMESA